MSSSINKEKTKKTIAGILDKIRTEADPALLDQYLRLFRKEVSFFNRSKAAAYLLMQMQMQMHSDQGKGPRSAGRGDFSRRNDTAAAKTKAEKRPANAGDGDAQRYPLAEEDSIRLFFSMGRNRRVFPREILGLINTKTAIPKEDIGAIRILDNYSFVQVRDTVAEQIIEALNGMSFRGRPLTVNYAETRDNTGEDDTDVSEEDHDHSEEEDI